MGKVKVTLIEEFDTVQDEADFFHVLSNRYNYRNFVFEMAFNFWRRYKHDENEGMITIERLRSDIKEILEENNLSIEQLENG
jgi:hypothetical protein